MVTAETGSDAAAAAASTATATTAASRPQRGGHLERLLLDCMRKSSVRGLPRILNTRSACLKALWATAVLLFFVVMMYNIVQLTVAYQRGDVIMTWKPWSPRPPFPSVTVCDASPVTRSGLRSLSLTPRLYSERIKQMAGADSGNLTAYLEELLTPMAYHDQLDAKELQAASSMDPLILAESCRIYYEYKGVKRSKQCARVNKVQVPGYFSCSTVHVSDNPDEEVYRLALHVLLDSDTDGLRCNRCIIDNVESLKIGAIVYLHERDVYPADISDGIRLSPGTQSFVHVKATQTVYQRYCQLVSPELLTLYMSDQIWRVKYTTELCDYLGRHDSYRDECNCSMSCLPHSQPDQHNDSAYAPCFKQDLTAPSLDLSSLICVMQLDGKLQVSADAADDIRARRPRCESPCDQVRFTVARSEAKGIDANSALDFFQRFVLNTTALEHIRDRLDVYATALQLRSAGLDDEARRMLANASYLEDNLITVIFQFNSNQAKQVTENYILSMSAFISQIGGLLSLFTGITVICIAEIAELLWLVCRYLLRDSCSQGATEDTVAF